MNIYIDIDIDIYNEILNIGAILRERINFHKNNYFSKMLITIKNLDGRGTDRYRLSYWRYQVNKFHILFHTTNGQLISLINS